MDDLFWINIVHFTRDPNNYIRQFFEEKNLKMLALVLLNMAMQYFSGMRTELVNDLQSKEPIIEEL